jgi:hypothetical protein
VCGELTYRFEVNPPGSQNMNRIWASEVQVRRRNTVIRAITERIPLRN